MDDHPSPWPAIFVDKLSQESFMEPIYPGRSRRRMSFPPEIIM
jgi:hypothetical protein